MTRVRLQSLTARLPAVTCTHPHPGASPITEPPRSPTGSHHAPHRPRHEPDYRASALTYRQPALAFSLARARLQSLRAQLPAASPPAPSHSPALTPTSRCSPPTTIAAPRRRPPRCLGRLQPTSGRPARPHRGYTPGYYNQLLSLTWQYTPFLFIWEQGMCHQYSPPNHLKSEKHI